MLAAQAMYGGADAADAAEWSNGDIALGRSLVRQLPEDRFDRGPVLGGEGRFVLVGDVRLDNREEIAAQVGLQRDRLALLSDSDVLMSAYQHWRDDCLEHLLGDFAFALWDSGQRTLMLARDASGQRPLHYHVGGGVVAFSTMAAGLHALPEIDAAPDEERLCQFVMSAPGIGERTFSQGVRRVEAGHSVVLSTSGVVRRRHWNPVREPIRFSRSNDYVDAMREQLDLAVGRRLRSVGAIGAQLSGGLDSSAVAATAARLLAGSGGRISAFTAVPRSEFMADTGSDRMSDEGALAGDVAAMHPNMDWFTTSSVGRSLMQDLTDNLTFAARPALNLSNVGWIFDTYEAARTRGAKVLLTGNAGNITLSYSGFERLPELLRHGRLRCWALEAKALTAHAGMSWRGVAAMSFRPFGAERLWQCAAHYFGRAESNGMSFTLLAPARLPAARRAMAATGAARRQRTDPFAARLSALRREDPGLGVKAALAGWGIDLRDPLTDRRLVEFALRVPSAEYLRDGQPRSLARRVLADRVPATLLNELGRGRQAADWYERLESARPALADEIDHIGANVVASRLLDVARMRNMVQKWPINGWNGADRVAGYRVALLRGLSAGHFARSFAHQEPVVAPPPDRWSDR
ncbi:asparagine synthetase B [Sphingomonas psychrolutea]|uniref:asparagine synthase (glutamine-hydrolyzing) n=2 Tax=Sphingomonas psychrolutea TaxID=1259676 RepID=A0ABQ1H7B1_9SPHN|nr:asparagine synthetase B [Sphingomonas psychrolutea]